MVVGVDPNSPPRAREDEGAGTEARLRQAATERRLASVQAQFGGTTVAEAHGMDVQSNREAKALDAAADVVRWNDQYGHVPKKQLGDAKPPVDPAAAKDKKAPAKKKSTTSKSSTSKSGGGGKSKVSLDPAGGLPPS